MGDGNEAFKTEPKEQEPLSYNGEKNFFKPVGSSNLFPIFDSLKQPSEQASLFPHQGFKNKNPDQNPFIAKTALGTNFLFSSSKQFSNEVSSLGVFGVQTSCSSTSQSQKSKKSAKNDVKKVRIGFEKSWEREGTIKLKKIIDDLVFPEVDLFLQIKKKREFPLWKQNLKQLFSDVGFLHSVWSLELVITEKALSDSFDRVLKFFINNAEFLHPVSKNNLQNKDIKRNEVEFENFCELVELLESSSDANNIIKLSTRITEILCFSIFFTTKLWLSFENLNVDKMVEDPWLLFSLLEYHNSMEELNISIKSNASLEIIGAIFKLLKAISKPLTFTLNFPGEQAYLKNILETLENTNFPFVQFRMISCEGGQIELVNGMLSLAIDNSNSLKSALHSENAAVELIKLGIKLGNQQKISSMKLSVKFLDESLLEGLKLTTPYFDISIFVEKFSLSQQTMELVNNLGEVVQSASQIFKRNIAISYGDHVECAERGKMKIRIEGIFDECEMNALKLVNELLAKHSSSEVCVEANKINDLLSFYEKFNELLSNFENISKFTLCNKNSENSPNSVKLFVEILNKGKHHLSNLVLSDSCSQVKGVLSKSIVTLLIIDYSYKTACLSYLNELEKQINILASSDNQLQNVLLGFSIESVSSQRQVINKFLGSTLGCFENLKKLRINFISGEKANGSPKPPINIFTDTLNRKNLFSYGVSVQLKTECIGLTCIRDQSILNFNGQCNAFIILSVTEVVKRIQLPLQLINLNFGNVNSLGELNFLMKLVDVISEMQTTNLLRFRLCLADILEIDTEKSSYSVSVKEPCSVELILIFFECLENIVQKISTAYPSIHVRIFFLDGLCSSDKFWARLGSYVRKEYKIDFVAILNVAPPIGFLRKCVTSIPDFEQVVVDIITRGVIFTKNTRTDKLVFSQKANSYKQLVSQLEISKLCRNLVEISFLCDFFYSSSEQRAVLNYLEDFLPQLSSLKILNIQLIDCDFSANPENLTSVICQKSLASIQLTIEMNEEKYDEVLCVKYLKELVRRFFSGFSIAVAALKEDKKNNFIQGFFNKEGISKKRTINFTFNKLTAKILESIATGLLEEISLRELSKISSKFCRFAPLIEGNNFSKLEELTLECEKVKEFKFLLENMAHFPSLYVIKLLFHKEPRPQKLKLISRRVNLFPHIISFVVVVSNRQEYFVQELTDPSKIRAFLAGWILKSRLRNIFPRRLIRMNVLDFLI